MDKKLTKAEVQAELNDRSESMQRRLKGLEAEVKSAQTSARDAVFGNPWWSVGGAAVAGLALGLLVGGGRKRKTRYDLDSAHGTLVDEYLRALGEDVRRAVDWGDDPETAVRDAFKDRAPLIVNNPSSVQESQGAFRESLDLLLKTGFSLLVKYVIDLASTQAAGGSLGGNGLPQPDTGDDAVVAAAAASEA